LGWREVRLLEMRPMSGWVTGKHDCRTQTTWFAYQRGGSLRVSETDGHPTGTGERTAKLTGGGIGHWYGLQSWVGKGGGAR